MEISQELVVAGVLLNTVGLGGMFKWLFTNEHERRNLVSDVLYLKNKLAEKGQKIQDLEWKLNDQATEHKMLEKEFSYIKLTLDEIKTMLAKITK